MAKTAKRGIAVRELRVAVPDVGFEEIVRILRATWTAPRLPGLRGCAPCRSGFDRLVIEDPALNTIGH
jgi:hypothetical protein